MKYFLDTEFYEDGKTIDLISIALVADDGRRFYAENTDFDWSRVPADHWVHQNVRPHLRYDRVEKEKIPPFEYPDILGYKDGAEYTMCGTREFIAAAIKRFIAGIYYEEDLQRPGAPAAIIPEAFYAYFADYDWVVFCQLFGRMVDLPDWYPRFCMDLKQMMKERSLTKEWKQFACPDPEGEHNAMVDAQWNKRLFEAIIKEKAVL